MGTADISDRVELFISIDYNSHAMKFVGKENETAAQEDIKFKLNEFSIPFYGNYNYLIVDDYDEFKFGILAGPAFHLLHNFKVVDDAKSDYVLEPLLASPNDLKFDERNEEISFNVFGTVGLTAQYNRRVLAQLKYSWSLTDPYRQASIVSRFVAIAGQDSILSVSVTYFLNASD